MYKNYHKDRNWWSGLTIAKQYSANNLLIWNLSIFILNKSMLAIKNMNANYFINKFSNKLTFKKN